MATGAPPPEEKQPVPPTGAVAVDGVSSGDQPPIPSTQTNPSAQPPTEEPRVITAEEVSKTPPQPSLRERLKPFSLSALKGNVENREWNAEKFRYQGARTVALFIVATFAGTLSFVLIMATVVMYWGKTPAEGKVYVDAFSAFLEKAGSFATTVFGPLLAFILGYYFGKAAEGSTSPKAPASPSPPETPET